MAGVALLITCDSSIDAYWGECRGQLRRELPRAAEGARGHRRTRDHWRHQVGDELTCESRELGCGPARGFLYRAPASCEYQWLARRQRDPWRSRADYTRGARRLHLHREGHQRRRERLADQRGVQRAELERRSTSKFYDANANGQFDAAESTIADWKVQVDGLQHPDASELDAQSSDYRVTESDPECKTNWRPPTAGSVRSLAKRGR